MNEDLSIRLQAALHDAESSRRELAASDRQNLQLTLDVARLRETMTEMRETIADQRQEIQFEREFANVVDRNFDLLRAISHRQHREIEELMNGINSREQMLEAQRLEIEQLRAVSQEQRR